MEIPKDNITKKTLYLFKKFLREEKAWEQYKYLSVPLKTTSLIDIINENEPVYLLQGSQVFCPWPWGSAFLWEKLSKKWARICIQNNLYRNHPRALRYLGYISLELYLEFRNRVENG